MEKVTFVMLFFLVFSLGMTGRGVNQVREDQVPLLSFSNNENVRGFHETGSMPERYSNVYNTNDDGFVTEELSQLLMKMEEVRNVRIFDYNDQLLIAIDTDTHDPDWLKFKIKSYVHLYFPNRDIVIITDREQVDQIRSLKSINNSTQGEKIGLQLRQFFNEINGQIEKQFLN